jgi:hypothetical protein
MVQQYMTFKKNKKIKREREREREREMFEDVLSESYRNKMSIGT